MRLPDKKINPENAAPDQPDILPNESGYTRKKSRFKGTDPKGEKLRFGKKNGPEQKKTSHVSSAVLTQRMHAEIEKQDQDGHRVQKTSPVFPSATVQRKSRSISTVCRWTIFRA